MATTELKRLIKIAIQTGKLMLENGAETYRVEDTVQRMIASKGNYEVNVFVIPTGIMLSVVYEENTITLLERAKPEGIDLESIDRANEFSRRFTNDQMTLDTAELELATLLKTPKFSKPVRILASGMAGSFFVLLFGGSMLEFFLAYLASSLTVYITDEIDSKHLNFFIKNILGGFVATFSSIILVLIIRMFDLTAAINMVIIGPLMMLVPGVSLTNGIRDLISGELLAGSAKIMEALFIAIALAFGVGIVLQFSLKLL